MREIHIVIRDAARSKKWEEEQWNHEQKKRLLEKYSVFRVELVKATKHDTQFQDE